LREAVTLGEANGDKKSLAIEKKLGQQEGMALAYGSLGFLYQKRGDLDRAEEMFKKSLAIEKKLGQQEGMADQYGRLGFLYETRGQLDRAEEMYKKALAIDDHEHDLFSWAWLFLTMAFGMSVQVLATNFREGQPLMSVESSQLLYPLLFSIVVFYPIWGIGASAPRNFFSFYAAFLNGFFWQTVVAAAKPLNASWGRASIGKQRVRVRLAAGASTTPSPLPYLLGGTDHRFLYVPVSSHRRSVRFRTSVCLSWEASRSGRGAHRRDARGWGKA